MISQLLRVFVTTPPTENVRHGRIFQQEIRGRPHLRRCGVSADRVCASHECSSSSPEGFTYASTTLQGALCPPHFRDEETGSDRFVELAQGCTEPGFASQYLKPEQSPLLLNDQPQDPEVWGERLGYMPLCTGQGMGCTLDPQSLRCQLLSLTSGGQQKTACHQDPPEPLACFWPPCCPWSQPSSTGAFLAWIWRKEEAHVDPSCNDHGHERATSLPRCCQE